MPQPLSRAVVHDLCHALGVSRLPPTIAADLADALARYRATRHDDHRKIDQQRASIVRLRTAGKVLQREMRRADAVFPIRGPWFISTRWHALDEPVTRLLGDLDGWLRLHPPPARGQGNPHPGKRLLRLDVLSALDQADIRISKSAQGKAAKVWGICSASADGRPALREVNGAQWTKWVAEYQSFKQAFEVWLTQRPNGSRDGDVIQRT